MWYHSYNIEYDLQREISTIKLWVFLVAHMLHRVLHLWLRSGTRMKIPISGFSSRESCS